MKDRAVILGGGGHAKVILDILDQGGEVDIAGFTSIDGRPDTLCGYRCLGTDAVLQGLFESGVRSAFAAIGENEQRKDCLEALRKIGFNLINAISQHACVSRYASLGRGVAVMPGAAVNAGARLDDGAIVNTNACVDHDCMVGPYAHIGPGATLAGCVRVGEGGFLGAGSSVIPHVTVGCWTTVGAGAVVVRDIPDHVVAAGIPASVKRAK